MEIRYIMAGREVPRYKVVNAGRMDENDRRRYYELIKRSGSKAPQSVNAYVIKWEKEVLINGRDTRTV